MSSDQFVNTLKDVRAEVIKAAVPSEEGVYDLKELTGAVDSAIQGTLAVIEENDEYALIATLEIDGEVEDVDITENLAAAYFDVINT